MKCNRNLELIILASKFNCPQTLIIDIKQKGSLTSLHAQALITTVSYNTVYYAI